MNIMETVGNVLPGIFCGLGLFVVSFLWMLCEEEIKAWWKRRR